MSGARLPSLELHHINRIALPQRVGSRSLSLCHPPTYTHTSSRHLPNVLNTCISFCCDLWSFSMAESAHQGCSRSGGCRSVMFSSFLESHEPQLILLHFPGICWICFLSCSYCHLSPVFIAVYKCTEKLPIYQGKQVLAVFC